MNLPLPLTPKMSLLRGVDAKGCDQILDPVRNGVLLFDAYGRAIATEGDSANPIITPKFWESSDAAASVMVQDSWGRWYRLVPSENGVKKRLVHEAGSIFFEDLNKGNLTFTSEDVQGNGDCDFDFAVWSSCGAGSGQMILKRISKEDALGGAEALDGVDADNNGYDGIVFTKLVDGKMVEVIVKPDCGKIIEACCDASDVPKWFVHDRGLAFHPLSAPVAVVTITSDGAHSVTLPQYPIKPCGDVFAVFQTFMQGGNANSSASLTLGAYRICAAESNLAAGAVNFAEARAKCDSATVVFTSVHGNAVAYSFFVNLIGYYY